MWLSLDIVLALLFKKIREDISYIDLLVATVLSGKHFNADLVVVSSHFFYPSILINVVTRPF